MSTYSKATNTSQPDTVLMIVTNSQICVCRLSVDMVAAILQAYSPTSPPENGSQQLVPLSIPTRYANQKLSVLRSQAHFIPRQRSPTHSLSPETIQFIERLIDERVRDATKDLMDLAAQYEKHLRSFEAELQSLTREFKQLRLQTEQLINAKRDRDRKEAQQAIGFYERVAWIGAPVLGWLVAWFL